ncbi:hypothetical protein [Actinomyces viscosus]|uniref:hypothetical protein n=1 Tax=Actinomyces viscosus TaxID=1656 RepID=UPI0028E21A37|nr:hypothetical protein [Actinomyces viscosus]
MEGAFDVIDDPSVIAQCKKTDLSAGSWTDQHIADEHRPTTAILAGQAGTRAYDCRRIINIAQGDAQQDISTMSSWILTWSAQPGFRKLFRMEPGSAFVIPGEDITFYAYGMMIGGLRSG